MRKKILSWIFTTSMVFLLFTALPITANAQTGACEIIDGDGVTFIKDCATLDEALTDVTEGQTIRLLMNISYQKTLYVIDKSFSIDVNGFNLTIEPVKNNCIFVGNMQDLNIYDKKTGGSLTVTASGKDNLTGLYAADISSSISINVPSSITVYSANGIGVRADELDRIDINSTTTIKVTGSDTKGVYTYSGGSVNILDGTITATTYGVESYGKKDNTPSSITVVGNITASSMYANGANVSGGGAISITGDIMATDFGYGVWVEDGNATVTGDVTAGNYATYATGINSIITITGDVFATGADSAGADANNGGTITINGNASGKLYGVFALYGGKISVSGNTTAAEGVLPEYPPAAANADGSSSSVVVGGNATVTGNNGYGVMATNGGVATVGGNVSASGSGCFGAYSGKNVVPSFITIEGTIDAPKYINIDGDQKNKDETTKPTTKSGYYTYSWAEGSSVVWVRASNPSAENVSIIGTPEVGENLTGSYTFNGSTESGTTYRWFENSGNGSTVFNTNNISGVGNGPTVPTTFTISEPTLISRVVNYHYNNGRGYTPGTITFQESGGATYGPWDAVGEYYNYYWVVNPYVILPPGSYTIIDSSNETWATNYESGYMGMTEVYTKNYNSEFTSVDGADLKTYRLSSNDLGKMFEFEVTVSDTNGLTGLPVMSSPIGPVINPIIIKDNNANLSGLSASGMTITPAFDASVTSYSANVTNNISSTTIMAIAASDTATVKINGTTGNSKEVQLNEGSNLVSVEVTAEDGETSKKYTINIVREIYIPVENQPPVLTSDWNYTTVYYGQEYPFTISVTDYENTPNTKLYSYIDDASPSQSYNFTVVPGTVNISLAPLKENLSAGSHTLNYYAVDVGGAVSSVLVLPFIIVEQTSSEASLSSISLTDINLTPAFNSETLNYTASVNNSISSTTVTAITISENATVKINGISGNSKTMPLNVGSNLITVVVTAEDGETSKTYTIDITRKDIDSGNSGGSLQRYYTITAKAEKGGKISPSGNISVSEGKDKDFTITANEGYIIFDLLVDGKSVGAVDNYTFKDISKAHTITAKFSKKVDEKLEEPESLDKNIPFTDVSQNDWFANDVMWAYKKGLMNGTNGTTFDPHGITTRGMIVTILYRLEGSPTSEANTFIDVETEEYYANAVAWAAKNEIVNGYGNEKFGPEDPITREQLATILMNYAKYKGYDVSSKDDLSKFADFMEISNWADDSIAWASFEKLIQGDGNILMPAGNAGRAQAAAILHRFVDNIINSSN